MRYFRTGGNLALAINPSTYGFGYALFERPHELIDWGVRRVSLDKNPRTLLKIAILFQLYQPTTLVIEDYAGPGSRRSLRIEELIDDIVLLAGEKRIKTYRYSRAAIRVRFEPDGARTKDEIARVLVKQYPELAPSLPPRRRIWMGEDYRMAAFDAVALAETHFGEQDRERKRH